MSVLVSICVHLHHTIPNNPMQSYLSIEVGHWVVISGYPVAPDNTTAYFLFPPTIFRQLSLDREILLFQEATLEVEKKY